MIPQCGNQSTALFEQAILGKEPGEWLDNYVAVAEVDGSDYVMLNDRLADGSDDMNIYWRWEDPVFLDQRQIRARPDPRGRLVGAKGVAVAGDD